MVDRILLLLLLFLLTNCFKCNKLKPKSSNWYDCSNILYLIFNVLNLMCIICILRDVCLKYVYELCVNGIRHSSKCIIHHDIFIHLCIHFICIIKFFSNWHKHYLLNHILSCALKYFSLWNVFLHFKILSCIKNILKFSIFWSMIRITKSMTRIKRHKVYYYLSLVSLILITTSFDLNQNMP